MIKLEGENEKQPRGSEKSPGVFFCPEEMNAWRREMHLYID